MFSPVIDKLLSRLVSRSFRRGLAGEPVFLVLGAAAWLVVRSRNKERPVVWSGTLNEGDKLALARTRLEKGENEELGAAFAEIAIEHYTLQKYTSATYTLASRLNRV